MNKRKYVVIILLCMTAWLQARNSVKAFDEFFVTGMKRIEGVFPVCVVEKEVYLEMPHEYIGREIEVRGQIDGGFDLLNRPVTGLGVAHIMSPDKATICFQKPFYTERVLDEKSVYRRSFSLSNIQPIGDSYPVVAYSKEQGAVIRVTKYLVNGNDWFSYNHDSIRSLVPELSEVTEIHPLEEGVSLTVRRYHGVEAERYMFSSSTIILPGDSIPLEVTCVIHLLPQKRDQIRLADHRIPYQTLTFKDCSQDPYYMIEDSLILRWDMSKPLTFYVDTLFPKECFQVVREGILVWSTIFRKVDIRGALQVKHADNRVILAEQRTFASCDLMMPGIKSSFIWYPRTGEILSCRVNIGHEFQKGKLDDYLLSYGAPDPHIIADRYTKEMKKELLQNEITGRIGHLLGLRGNLSKDSCGTTMKVGRGIYRVTYFGYNPLKGNGDCYDEREQLRRWINKDLPDRTHSLPPSDYAAKALNLRIVLNQLDKIVYKGGKRDKGSSLIGICRKAIRQYRSYLTGIAETMGSSQPTDAQHQAILELGNYLFHPVEKMECTYVKGNLLEARNNIPYLELVKIFRHLLSIETILALRLQALHSNQRGCGDGDFFRDLYKGLFNDFDSSATVSYEQMDIQLVHLDAWLDIIQENAKRNSTTKRLRDELYSLYNRLEELSTIHPRAEVCDMYTLLVERIK